jgi:predicted GTPase
MNDVNFRKISRWATGENQPSGQSKENIERKMCNQHQMYLQLLYQVAIIKFDENHEGGW